RRQPSLRGQNGLGLGVMQYTAVYDNRGAYGNTRYNAYASPGSLAPSNPQFCPPTITITSSSPRSSFNGPVSRSRTTNETTDVSPSHSLQRVSVYDHPAYGAQLVTAPKLRVVGEETDSATRNSGWSSWDDGVGLEMGVKLDRRSKRGLEPMRPTLQTVIEVEDVSEVEDSARENPSSRNGSHEQNMRTYSRPSYSSRSPSSPLRSSPRSLRNASPRTVRKNSGGKDTTLLYDMPRFSDSSSSVPPVGKFTSSSDESGAGPISSSSPSPKRRSASTRIQYQDFGSGTSASAKRRSRRASRATPTQPSPTLTDVLVDAYSYVRTYAVSDDESGEQPSQRPLKRSSTSSRRAKRSSRRKSSRNLPAGISCTPEEPSQVHSRVGTLMLTAYGEEGGLVNGVSSPSIPRFDGKGKRHAERRSSKAALAESTNEARYNRARAINPQGYTSEHSSPLRTAVKLSQRDMYSTTSTEGASKPGRSPAVTCSPESTYSTYTQRPAIQSYYKNVPSLPPLGQPSLHQLKLMRDMPDYRSPTYSIYGMYRDANRDSSWGNGVS
ncbi:688_t:CDS:2, partial [Acaulospora colombiana]